MVSGVSNSSVNTNGYIAGVNSGQGFNSTAGPSVSGQGSGQISYGAYNGSASNPGDDKKLEEMDGMLNRLHEMLGGKGSPDKKKTPDTAGTDMLKEDKLDKADKLDKTDKPDKTDKLDTSDKLGKDDELDKGDIDNKEEADASDNSLKAKALDVLNKVTEVLSRIFGKESPTSPAPSGSSAP